MNKRQWHVSVILASIGAAISIVAAAQYFDIASLLRTQVVSQHPCGFFGGGEVCLPPGMFAEEEPVEKPPCNNRIDDDGDRRVDGADPACHEDFDVTKPFDPTRAEGPDPQCVDGDDNDKDELIDDDDPGCIDPQTEKYDPLANEAEDQSECENLKDDDNDGFVDAKDPGCHPARKLKTPYDPDEDEIGGIACSDGADNETKLVEGEKVSDGDNRVDAADPGCYRGGVLHFFPWLNIKSHYNPNDTSEAGEAACANGKDDNGNELIDEADPSCHLGGRLNWFYLPRRSEL